MQSVDVGHVVVEDREVEGGGLRCPRTQESERLVSSSGPTALHPPDAQLFLEDLVVRPVVVHDKRLQPLEVVPGDRGPEVRIRNRPERNGEHEIGPLAGLAFDPDRAAHHLDELPGDGQAEPGAPEIPRGGPVRLREGIEDPRLRFHGDTDPRVADGEPDGRHRVVP